MVCWVVLTVLEGTKPHDPEDRHETNESEEQRLEAQQPKGHPA